MSVKRAPGPGMERFNNAIKSLDKTEAKIGWFPSSRYENGIPVATIAAQNEFGNPVSGIPSRSVMRTTIAEKQESWKKTVASGAKAVLAGNETSKTVMEKMGLLVAGQIRAKIASIQDPPLKAATVRARVRKTANGKVVGNLTKPLVETKYMLNSLTHTVE